MLDPLILQIISLGFALLFLLAALHKFSNRIQFRGVLEVYQILPGSLLGFAANTVPVVELLLGLGWIGLGFFGVQLQIVPLVSTLLLMSYALAIGVNLLRGRNYIDCGCGFGSTTGKQGNNSIQQLSGGLLIRNGLLMLAAIVASLPVATRDLGLIDFLGLIAASLSLILLYGAFNQLMVNRNAIGAWRNTSPEKSHG